MDYLFTVTSRGREFHYYRRAGRRIPLGSGMPADAPEIVAAWAAAHKAFGEDGKEASPPKRGTLAQLIDVYLESTAYAALADETQRTRAAALKRYRNKQGARPAATLTRDLIEAGLAKKTPHAAATDLKHLRATFAYAAKTGLIAADPTEGIRISLPESEGFRTATPEEVAAYLGHYARGTQARLVGDLAFLTGQRRGDLVRMGRHMERGGLLEVRQKKTGATALIPLTAELIAAVEPFRGQMLYIQTSFGKPRTANGLGTQFRRWAGDVPAPGFPGSLHSFRKAFCCYHAEKGRTPHQIAAMSGHMTLKEVEGYTRAADRRRMVEAMLDVGLA